MTDFKKVIDRALTDRAADDKLRLYDQCTMGELEHYLKEGVFLTEMPVLGEKLPRSKVESAVQSLVNDVDDGTPCGPAAVEHVHRVLEALKQRGRIVAKYNKGNDNFLFKDIHVWDYSVASDGKKVARVVKRTTVKTNAEETAISTIYATRLLCIDGKLLYQRTTSDGVPDARRPLVGTNVLKKEPCTYTMLVQIIVEIVHGANVWVLDEFLSF